ncbi:CFAP36 [Bugula neritina]|uniref:Cilia- and flagella-associated protein 36 n=1 Tax=Bugula neritina TaxID=10212 RepID=A0A7J7JPY9_BUGNE|nr:CFAP36 [Bugula neritina]
MARQKSDWVYDELLNYVGSPLFQAPVISFMESNCLIFDPSLEDCKEYRELHGAYCALVTVLLDAFRQDTKLTHDQVIKAMTEMSRRTELRAVFSGLFELILATESFTLFSRLMTQKNLELQQQALLLIMKQYGQIPEVLQTAKPEAASQPKASAADNQTPAVKAVKEEDAEVLNSVIRSTEKSAAAKPTKEDEEMKKVAVAEAALIKAESNKEQQKLEQAMKDLMLDKQPSEESKVTKHSVPVTKPALPRLTNHAAALPTPTQSQKPPVKVTKTAPVGDGDAASLWIAQAKAENDHETVTAVQTAAATFSQMPPDELQKRQKYLQEQRQKLTAMKQKEREKQLETYEKTTTSRPKSARVARSALSRAPESAPAESEEKKKELDMRKAIANRLKAEVLETRDFK